MSERIEWVFKIEGHHTPATLPMARLAEYLAELSGLYGHADQVHFTSIKEGSATIHHEIEKPIEFAVGLRLVAARAGAKDAKVRRPYQKLCRMVAEDGGTGILSNQHGVMLHFQAEPEEALQIQESGELAGELIALGGPNESAPVQIQSARVKYPCRAKRELIKEMAPYIFQSVRVRGEGTWVSEKSGWRLVAFSIHGFEPLRDRRLTDVINELRALPGNRWNAMEDPMGEAHRLRYGKT